MAEITSTQGDPPPSGGTPNPTAGTPPSVPASRPGVRPLLAQPQPPQQSISGFIVFLIFFFMINGNQTNPTFPDTNIYDRNQKRLAEVQTSIEVYEMFINGTKPPANTTGAAITTPFTYPNPLPHELLGILLPPVPPTSYSEYYLSPIYSPNITGFIRHSISHPLNLSHTVHAASLSSSLSIPSGDISKFWSHLNSDSLSHFGEIKNESNRGLPGGDVVIGNTFNETNAEWLRGDFDWMRVDDVGFTLKEGFWGSNQTWRMSEELLHVKGTMDIRTNTSEQLTFNIEGTHLIKNGTLLLLATQQVSLQSPTPDLRPLPSLFDPRTSKSFSNTTSYQVLNSLKGGLKNLRAQEKMGQDISSSNTDIEINPYTNDPIRKNFGCSFVLELRLDDLRRQGVLSSQIDEYEHELRLPSGLPGSVGGWEVSFREGVAVSWDCGVALGLEKAEVLRADKYWRKSINYSTFFFAVHGVLVWLLLKQMESTRSPSALGKVAFGTVVMQGIMDGWSFSGHLMVGIVASNKASMSIIAPGFLACMSFAVFAPRYASSIYRVQAPENAPRQIARAPNAPAPPSAVTQVRTALAAANATSVAATVTPLVGLPQPVTTTPVTRLPPPRPMFVSSEGGNGSPLLLLLLVFFILMQTGLISIFAPLIIFGLFSFWVPQIYRNAKMGTRRGLRWSYIIGSTCARLCIPLYFWGCEENVSFIEKSNWVYVLVVYMFIQVTVLLLQDTLGPTFFLPLSMAPPPPYNYHPVLPSHHDKEAGGALLGEDCAICMEVIETEPTGGPGEVVGVGGRKNYAVAPCQHIFHTNCLETWLAIKNVCPQCRRPLPPL